jgi:hypothetical protein
MSRRLQIITSLVVLALIAPVGAVPAPVEVEKKPAAVIGKARELREQLGKPVNLDKGIDGNTPLKDALEFLSQQYGLTFIVNSEAFTAIGVQQVEEQPVHLPKMVGVPISKALSMLLSQIKGDEEAGTYLIRGGEVEITTTANASPSKWTEEARRFAPTVDADFDRVPLEEALRELAARSGISIVLDIRVGENGRKPVTATLSQVPVDSAVRVVADMTDLRMTVIDNVLYVTTRENAKELESRPAKK